MFGMSSEQWAYAFGVGVAGVFFILLLAALFISAYNGNNKNFVTTLWIVALTGIVGIGLISFNEGEGGFEKRITNIPEIETAVGYSVSTMIVMALFVWWRNRRVPEVTPKQKSAVGRNVALLVAIPITLVGLGNIAGSAYVAATQGVPGPGLGGSRAEMRDIMLNGDLALFWRVVDERVPTEMDYIIEQVFAQEDDIRSVDQVRQILNQELVNFRVSLATHAWALNDTQRKEIMQGALDMLRAYEDRPVLCLDIAMTGGQNLTKEQLLSTNDLLNQNMIVMTENLLDARAAASEEASYPTPPTEEDFGLLVQMLIDRRMSDDQLQAVFNEDTSHPQFCQLQIAFFEAVMDLEGPRGEAVRFGVGQAALTAAP